MADLHPGSPVLVRQHVRRLYPELREQAFDIKLAEHMLQQGYSRVDIGIAIAAGSPNLVTNVLRVYDAIGDAKAAIVGKIHESYADGYFKHRDDQAIDFANDVLREVKEYLGRSHENKVVDRYVEFVISEAQGQIKQKS